MIGRFLLTPSLPEYLMEFCKVTLTFESVDEILRCDHSNESSLLVLSHDAICLSKFLKMKCGNLVEICLRPHLAVKGLTTHTSKFQFDLEHTGTFQRVLKDS